MNRIDRLFAILLLLQHKSQLRARDLAEKFGVSLRTVYRDVSSLIEMGVPIVSLPAKGYQLMEGIYLPPLIFTPDEANALVLGARLLSMQAAERIAADAESAIVKVTAVLPGPTRDAVDHLSEMIYFGMPDSTFDLDDPTLTALQHAIEERRVVTIRYHSYSRDEVTVRAIEPENLHYYRNAWYLDSYCRLRQDRRMFRLDRIEKFALLEEHFDRRPPGEVARTGGDDERVLVRVRFSSDVVRWVRERQHFYFVAEEVPREANAVVMRYHVRANRMKDMMRWIMSWGTVAEALEPPQLREAIYHEARKLAEMLT